MNAPAARSSMSGTSGGYFSRAVGELKTMGIIEYPQKNFVALSELIAGIAV